MKQKPDHEEPVRRAYEEALANEACEGIAYTAEEQALFEHILEQGMSEEDGIAYILTYFERTRRDRPAPSR